MAFDASRLRLVQIAAGDDLPNSWYYYTTDDLATVMGSGYFNGAPTEKMRVGDLIRVYNPTVDDNYQLEVESLSPITTNIANATGIETTIQGLLGEFIVDAYRPDYDAGDAAYEAAYEAAVAFVDANPGATGIIRFTHNIRLLEPHTIARNNIHVVASPGVEITVDDAVGDAEYLFSTTQQANGASTLINETEIAVGTKVLTFTSVTGFAAGDFVVLTSGEYFIGIPDVPGFSVTNKSERLRIKSIAGLEVTFFTGTADSYDCVSFPVTATKENLWRNIRFEGLTGIGTGVAGEGPGFIKLQGVTEVYCDVAFRLFGNGSVRFNNVDTFTVGGQTGSLLGFEAEDEEADSEIYGGYDMNGVTNGLMLGLRGQRLRRLVNFDVKDGVTVIPRSITCIGFKAEGCLNGLGTHVCDDIAFFNCVGNNSPVYYRAKNPTIIGCEFSATGTNTSSAVMLLGQTSGTVFSQNPSMGKVNIQDNKLFSQNVGILMRMSCDKGSIIANNKLDVRGHGLWFYGKTTEGLQIKGNVFDRSRGTPGGSSYGVYSNDQVAANPRESIDSVRGQGNEFINYVRAWVIDGSADMNAPFTNIIADGDSQDYGNGMNASFMLLDNGYFGPNVGAQNCSSVGPLSDSVFVSAAQDRSFFWQPPIRHNNVCMGYGSPITTLILASYSVGNRQTLTAGMAIEINPPIANEYAKYIVLTSGTTGSFPAVAADIASGDDQLEFASDPNSGAPTAPFLYPGVFLTVVGAGPASADLSARVIAYDDVNFIATLDTDAGTTVAAATVNYTAPTIKGTMMMEA